MIASWAKKEAAQANFGDERLDDRFVILLSELGNRPNLSIPAASKELHLSQPAVTKAMKALEKLGIVKESSGRAWKRVFVYSTYLRIMTEGTERPERLAHENHKE